MTETKNKNKNKNFLMTSLESLHIGNSPHTLVFTWGHMQNVGQPYGSDLVDPVSWVA